MAAKGSEAPAGAPAGPAEERVRITFSQYFLLLLLVISLVAFLLVIRVFLVPVILAAVFVTLFYPWYRLLNRLLGGRRGLASLLCCLSLLAGLLAPLVLIGEIVVQQAAELYQTAVPKVQEALENGDQGLLGRLRRSRPAQWLRENNINWRSPLQQGILALGKGLTRAVNAMTQLTLGFVVGLFVLLFTMFYFFRDGDRLVGSLRRLVPMEDRYKDAIVERFGSISRATIRVTMVIGVIQGTLGALTLLVFGISAWLLWGVVMFLLSVLPVLGSWMVLVPAGLLEIAGGRVWQGLTMIILSVGVISFIDNILRPRLVGRDVGMHDLLIFFSTLGGISLFGVMGFIVGPVVAAFFLTLTEIYSAEFSRQLEASRAGAPAGPAAGPKGAL